MIPLSSRNFKYKQRLYEIDNMKTLITVLREGRIKNTVDSFHLDNLTDMRRYVKAMERAQKSGKKFKILRVSNWDD